MTSELDTLLDRLPDESRELAHAVWRGLPADLEAERLWAELTDIDPSDEARKQRQRLTVEEQNEMHRYEEYLLWKRKK